MIKYTLETFQSNAINITFLLYSINSHSYHLFQCFANTAQRAHTRNANVLWDNVWCAVENCPISLNCLKKQ